MKCAGILGEAKGPHLRAFLIAGVDGIVAAAARQSGGTLMLRSDRLNPAELANEVLETLWLSLSTGSTVATHTLLRQCSGRSPERSEAAN